MRRGTTLAEMIVALVLGSIVIGLVARSVTAQRRSERTIAGASSSAAAADETIAVLTSALARVSRDDTVRLRADTAIDFDFAIGAGLPCVAGGDSVVLLDAAPVVWWETLADSGDGVDGLSNGQWWHAEVIASRARTALAGSCVGAQRMLRLRPMPPQNAAVPYVRITRRTRFMVYRGGEGAWWLGERTCNTSLPPVCASAQPVSGPLANARALQFVMDTVGGLPILRVTATTGSATRTATMALRQ